MNQVTTKHDVHRKDGSTFEVTSTAMRQEIAAPLIAELQAAGYSAWDNYSGACNWPPGLSEEDEHIHASAVAITGLSEADVRYLLKRKRRGS